ncbi:MAG TPA: polysaccharide deacetylase family protein [Solirubrobacteraceae bacterium]|nr:polysaccharide deacetylase family protein [Solirubrobacteraceae bacterium]
MAAITLTFDNLGEATALERGTWSRATPLGADPSVRCALPRLLDALDRHGLTATFCVEAINCGLNPDAVLEIAGRGHELALHGWRHEPWSELEPERERELLRRSLAAFAGLGLKPAGFRPPGGIPSPGDPELLVEHGLAWWSPVAAEENPHELMSVSDISSVPFVWDLVDAYLLMDSFSALRTRRGDPAAGLEPAVAGSRLAQRLSAEPGPHTLVMHPFLMLDDGWWEQVEGLLARVGDLVAAGRVECRTAGQAARP